MLEGFLSNRAAALYLSLLLTPDGAGQDESLFPDAMAELERLDLVFRCPGPPRRLVAVSPREAFDRLLAISVGETRAALDGLGRLLADLEAVAGHPQLWEVAGPSLPPIEVIEGATEVRRVAERLRAEATNEYLALIGAGQTSGPPPLGWPVAPAGGEPTAPVVRLVCGSLEAAGSGPGARCRVVPDVRVDARIVDGRRALIALIDVPRSALFIRSPVATVMLRQWFELLWDRGAPAGGGGSTVVPYQRRVLALLVAGHRDAHIARLTGTSTRTVRRHIAAMMLELGASTRFEAGVAARRKRWLEPTAAGSTGTGW